MSSSPSRRTGRLLPLPNDIAARVAARAPALARQLDARLDVPVRAEAEAGNEDSRSPVSRHDVVQADLVAATAANTTVGPSPGGTESPNTMIRTLREELEERAQNFCKQHNGRHPFMEEIRSDEAWGKSLARLQELESRYSVSQLLGVGSGSPLGQRSDALTVESKFREIVEKQNSDIVAAVAADKFRECAEKDASSAQLNEHVSFRLKETASKAAVYYLTKEGLRKVCG